MGQSGHDKREKENSLIFAARSARYLDLLFSGFLEKEAWKVFS